MMTVGQSATAFAAVVLFAQATLAQEGQAPITLDVIAQDGAFYQALIDRFEATGTPVSVHLQAPAENYEEVAQTALREALVGQSPDLVFMGYNRVRIAAERELAVPLGDLLDDEVMGVFFRFIHSGNWSWQALLTSHGGRIVSEDETQIAFDSPAGLRALFKRLNAGGTPATWQYYGDLADGFTTYARMVSKGRQALSDAASFFHNLSTELRQGPTSQPLAEHQE